MHFNEQQRDIIANALLLSREGKGMVLQPDAYPDAVELEEAGRLERRSEPDGPSSWWWTAQAEGALKLSALTTPAPGSQN